MIETKSTDWVKHRHKKKCFSPFNLHKILIKELVQWYYQIDLQAIFTFITAISLIKFHFVN